ncbi:SprT-like domain-containing protein [Varibaculum vaginae]|uniref:SprT-like domain-containing protein n=1 Tax=Varibaculum vaginae TaxID=2364797 RepID=UPI001356E1CC|nr:SprT-like domain-containing protein [Varibaculum vaginae]
MKVSDLDKVLELARRILDACGLQDWEVGLDNARRRAGACHFGDKRISFSRYLLPLYDAATARQVVLHEVAHAQSGPRAGHGKRWQQAVKALGGCAERTVAPDAPSLPAPWVGVCKAGHRVERFRTPTRVLACSKCSRDFRVENIFTWSYRGGSPRHHPAYLRELRKIQRGI